MNAAAQRLEFAPPPTPGMVRALGLAVIAHILLMAALTWGVNWKRDAVTLTAEAELWSAVPQQAAPKLVEAPPAPPVSPVEKAVPAPVPEVKAETPDADIVSEREKRRLEDKKRAEDKKRLEDKKKAEAKQAELKQAEQKQAELAAKRKEVLATQDAARKLDLQRQENIKRMAGLAGATGSDTATGKAQQTTGTLSSTYAGRIKARVKPNIVFTEDIAGNPTAEVEVRTSPDGTIVGRKLVKASGVASWDEAVLKAIDKTEVLPRDIDGKVPTPLVISFRPKD